MSGKEEWRPVENWPYEVSNLGRIRRSGPGKRTRVGRLLKPSTTNTGYSRVELYRDGEMRREYVHRLVAEAFHGPCPEGHECNHKNGVKDDNRPENLEWVTPSENNLHAFRVNGRKPTVAPSLGEAHGMAQLAAPDARAIRREYATGDVTYAELGERYGVDSTTIGCIVRGETWSHV